MLPSRPSPRNASGRPAEVRSRSVGRARQDEPSSNYGREPSARSSAPSSSRQMRPQRSMASMPAARDRDRSDRPPMPQGRSNPRPSNSQRPFEATRKQSDASSISTTSSAPSLFDRLRGGGGDTSSRTSIDEDYEPSKGGQSSYEADREDTSGAGSTLWGRLASAAGTLGIDVNKAWATNITAASGEETPPGQESRLTRAMKSYHLAKARDPSDLPEWLFEAHERRPIGRPRASGRQDDSYNDAQESAPAPRSRGLRDIYDSAAASPSSNSRTTSRADRSAPSRFADEPATASKATNRLKAIRDAKRQNNGRAEDDALARNEPDSSRRDGRSAPDAAASRLPPRIGLPTGPGGRARRV